MARVNLELPDVFTFSTHLTVRVSDINYGNHLGNDRMISLLHEARLRYLHDHDFSEFNIGTASGSPKWDVEGCLAALDLGAEGCRQATGFGGKVEEKAA
ncbi:MAG: hypothetical protein VYD52_03175, partial [Pseudomonadota bacterium]|nr:hypothetical protein [Pseudomonadota bacterium]